MMKKNTYRVVVQCVLLALLWGPVTYAQPGMALSAVRTKLNLNREWKFKLGDIGEAKNSSYSDKDWMDVNLPHNFSIPYFQSAQWYTGYGWYRKHFTIENAWRSKRLFIEFEGAFRDAEVYVNGQLAGIHQGGYTGFSFDITSLVQPGNNVLAVRLNNNYNRRLAPRNGDHNFTGGIYRDVYLVVTNEAHVTWYGTYVTTPKVSKDTGIVNIETEIKNDGQQAKRYTLRTTIIDPAGKTVSTVSSRQSIAAGGMVVFNQVTPALKRPQLWHPQHPFLYKAVSKLLEDDKVVDSYETTFGFRWMKWTADSGFYLNGEHYYFRGANAHQDQAGWASAVTNTALVRDIKMIRDCGMDFIRGSHYPHDPAYSDACDSLGILLWQENDFWGSGGNQRETTNWYSGGGAYPLDTADQSYFEESVKTNLREMVRIHRNHPSIIVWSMCNEPFFTDGRTIGRVRGFLKELTALTHQLDPTRPVGIGGCQRGGIDTLADIAGYNGDGARLFMHPRIPSVVTEYGSTIAKRPGRYIAGWGDLQQEKFAWRSGEAIWCAFDYGTRAGDFGLMGMIDYFRLPKNMWYWYRNAYKNIPPPEAAREGVAARLRLSADKQVIKGTDGTDDVQLIVTVLDNQGHPISNSPDVTLQIVSGPGEFPTGTAITFSQKSDIYIRDGKAAITFRSYYGGKTIVKAISTGLASDSMIIQTKGIPVYQEGVTPKVTERPYTRYTIQQSTTEEAAVDIAYQKPTRASSERKGFEANRANDKDTTTSWQPQTNDTSTWWQVDLENLYNISSVRLRTTGQNIPDRIELSKDGQHWELIGSKSTGTNNDSRPLTITTDSKITGRFLRLTISDSGNGSVTLSEIAVFGKTSQ